MTEFVFFDLGNVILHFDHEIGCRQVATLTGVDVDRVREVLFVCGIQQDYELGRISSQQVVARFCELTGFRPPDEGFSELFSRAASDIFWINRAILPVVTQLRAVVFPMGILSNTCSSHWEFINSGRFRSVMELFSEHVLSFASNCMKPDLRIFHNAIDRAGVSADRILFVDDRPENVAGAIEAGIDAHQYHSVPELVQLFHRRGLKINL
jgi:putative hydrolase of the HAD superfamily